MINLEHDTPVARDSVEELVFLDSIDAVKLRSSENNYGYLFERYSEILFTQDAKDRLVEFAQGLKSKLETGESSEAFKLASLFTCLDLSQAAMRVAERFDLRYPDSSLSVDDLQDIYAALNEAIGAIPEQSALVSIIKEKIVYIFDLYREHRILEVDIPARNYETDILGPILRLSPDGLGDTYKPNIPKRDVLSELLGSRRSIEGQPCQIAKGLVGYRDVSDRIQIIVPVDQEEIEKRIGMTEQEYYSLSPRDMMYLSGTDDSLVVDQIQRSTVLHDGVAIDTFLGAEKDMKEIFQEMQRPIVRAVIQTALGVSLKDVSLQDQLQLLRYASKCGREPFDRLCHVMTSLPEDDRLEMFEAFLAMEFGDEYGDVLVDIAEKLPNNEFELLLHEISAIRSKSEAIRQFFERNVDGELGQAIERAINKRITEVLALIKRIANEEPLLVHNRTTDQIEETNMDMRQALDRIRSISFGVESIANGLQSNFSVTQIVHDEKDFRGQFAHEGGRLKSTLRPRATRAGEARISFEVLDNQKQKLTIRLDLDTRFDAQGQLSLDIGSTANGQNNKEIAYFLSLAESAFAMEQGRDIRNLHGYHVREAFDAVRVDPEQFEVWVNKYMYALSISD